MICGFTGHRPHKLPWATDETDPRCLAVKEMIARRLQEAYDLGCREFLCGMAQGCDLYFAEAVLQLRAQDPEIRLVAMIPWPGQAKSWPVADRERSERLCGLCDRRVFVAETYSRDCMQLRNRAMVERAQVLISVYDGTSSGTGNTVRYARKLGLRILPVWV